MDLGAPKPEGTGNAGRSARPQPRVQMKKAHEHSHHGHAGFTRHSRHNGFNGLLRALPGEPGFLATIPSATRKRCHCVDISVGISGPHDFAVRIACARLAHAMRPSHPASNVRDDRETPLERRRDKNRYSSASTKSSS